MHFSKLMVAIRKGRLQPLHPIDQISLGRAHDQVEVICHHTKPFEYPPALFAGFKQTLLEGLVGAFVDKHILAVVPAVDNVIDSILFLNT